MTELSGMMSFLNNMVLIYVTHVHVCKYLIIYFKPFRSTHMAMWTIQIDFSNKTVPSIYDIWYLRSYGYSEYKTM